MLARGASRRPPGETCRFLRGPVDRVASSRYAASAQDPETVGLSVLEVARLMTRSARHHTAIGLLALALFAGGIVVSPDAHAQGAPAAPSAPVIKPREINRFIAAWTF